MKKIALVLLLILMIAVLTSCAQLTSGTCVDKKYVPAHTTRGLQPVWTGKVMINIPRTFHHSEQWQILVEGANDDNELVQEWWTVDKEKWESISIGDKVENANQ